MCLLLCSRALSSETAPAPVPMRGFVLPLYAQDPAFDYGFACEEIAATGANAVSLTVVLMQDNARSASIRQVDGRTVPDPVLRQTIRQARQAGLEVMILPIVLIENPGEDDWRGNLDPQSLDDWFASYRPWILHYARLAEEEGAAWFSVGSEFASLEKHTGHWRETIEAVRRVFTGRLLYSCNWDHLHGPAGWWGELDAMGLSSYYELTDDPDASQETLDAAWTAWRTDLLDQRARYAPGLPIVFTEAGYPAMDGAAVYPWDYTLVNPPDPDEQRRCVEAFIGTWDGREEVGGIFFFKWLGFDADDSAGYSPRGKPAEYTIRAWFQTPP